MVDDHEVDWGNDEDDLVPSNSLSSSIGMSHDTGGEPDDVEDAVSLGGDEEEEFAAYGARPNEQNTSPTDKPQTSPPKTDVSRRNASVSVAPKKAARQARPTTPLPPSPQPEVKQSASKLTHALPPKPVVTSSFRVPPSTTAASPMSLPRKERRSNGNATNTSDELPLSDREAKNSRNVVRETRHRESHPDESSWTRPGSNAPDLSSLPQDSRTKSFDDRDSRPSSRRDDDCYRPSHRRARCSSDEEGKDSGSHLVPSRNDMCYRQDDWEKRQNYASTDRNDRPTTRTARLSPEDESLDRARPGYRESDATDSRRFHTRDRDVSPVRDDSSRIPRRGDYPDYDSFDKGPRVFDDPPRRGAGTAERSRYPEVINGRTNSVSSRDPYAQNQGPGRSPTLRRNLPSPRPRSRSPLYNRREDRGITPPRYQEYPSDSRISHDRGRAESPPSRSRGSDRLIRHDALVNLPQRRPRTASDTRDPDYSAKRRKTEDRAVNPSIVGRAPVGPDTYTPQEISTASTSPRSTGAMDDFSRPRRREPLPSQSLRYKEASSDQRRPVSGSNRVMPHPQPTAPPHRHFPSVPREQDVLQSRHLDTDIGKPDRPRRGSGHDLVAHPYPVRRDDHMDVDPPYSSRVSQYEEPARPRELGNRSSSHTDVMIREAVPPIPRSRRRNSFDARPTTPVGSTPITTEKIRGRSRERSPRSYHEPRRTSVLASSAPLVTMPPRRDTQFVEDYRHHERRVDRGIESHSPTLPRNSSNAVAPRSQPSGRYDELGGQRPPRSPELRPTPPTQERLRRQVSNPPNTRRERQAPPISEPNETPIRARGDSTSKRDSPQERSSRPGPVPDTSFPPPPPPTQTSREWTPRKPVQPEFMLNLPPPSTRLPGAPPPPLLPPHQYGAAQDQSVYPSSLPPKDESGSAKVENDLDHQSPESPQEKFRPLPTSPIHQTKEVLRPQQVQEKRQQPVQVQLQQPSENSLQRPEDDDHKEKPRYGRHVLNSAEERRPNVPSDDRQIKPASWDRPRNSHPKPITLPASLPPKPVAALGDLSTSLRPGNQGRGRRAQQPSNEGSGHNARWGSAPRRDEGGNLNDRERNRWVAPAEYRPPPLLARMSSGDSLGRDVLEVHERGGGETQRKRGRTKKYQGV